MKLLLFLIASSCSWLCLSQTKDTVFIIRYHQNQKIATKQVKLSNEQNWGYAKAFDQQGNLLATASSSWLLMELNDRKMMAIPPELVQSIDRFFPDPSDCLPRPSGKLPLVSNADFEWNAQVGWFDLDFNYHLNNVTYASWMLNALPESVFKSKTLSNFQIRYTKEALLNDQIHCSTQQINEFQFSHQLNRVSDGADLAYGKSSWI